jgi:hypothetical protein
MEPTAHTRSQAPKLSVESHSIDYVPLRERHGKAWRAVIARVDADLDTVPAAEARPEPAA